MATTIRITNTCEQETIDILSDAVTAEVVSTIDSDEKLAVYSIYRYICPTCKQPEFKEIQGDNTLELLVAAGVEVNTTKIYEDQITDDIEQLLNE